MVGKPGHLVTLLSDIASMAGQPISLWFARTGSVRRIPLCIAQVDSPRFAEIAQRSQEQAGACYRRNGYALVRLPPKTCRRHLTILPGLWMRVSQIICSRTKPLPPRVIFSSRSSCRARFASRTPRSLSGRPHDSSAHLRRKPMPSSRWKSTASMSSAGACPIRAAASWCRLFRPMATNPSISISAAGGLILAKGKIQNRARTTMVLARIDFGGAPHRNPGRRRDRLPAYASLSRGGR